MHPATRAPESETHRRELARDEGGAVYVEFLIAFFPIFILVLGLVQMALMYTAHLVVQHAASTAARAAIVVLPDDPARYDGASIGSLADGRPGGTNPLEAFLSMLGGAANVRVDLPNIPVLGDLRFGGSDPTSPRNVYASRNGRMSAIHAAANIPLASISPSIEQLFARGANVNVRDALGRNEPALRAATALVYNQAAMAVTFPTGAGARTYSNSFGGRDQPVTVRVTYMFHCAVPIARVIMCKDPVTLRFGESGAARAFGDAVRRGDPAGIVGGYVGVAAAEAAEIAAHPELGELTVAPLYSLMLATSGTGQRYVVLRGEATLPMQGASYTYRTTPRSSGGGGGF